jgi:Xaa-Pro aminopeptidase
MASRRSSPALLLYADSEQNADQLYLGRFKCPDPFVSFRLGRRTVALLNALEFGRAIRESAFDDVLPYEDWQARAKKRLRAEVAGPAEVITTFARAQRIRRFQVAPNFPLGLARKLEGYGLRLETAPAALFPGREVKSDDEARAIAAGNRCCTLGFAAVEDLLRRAAIRRGQLWLDGRALTSERVQRDIEIACLCGGGHAVNTIVAGGDQACDPHCRGHGPLRANELIIVDVFPRMAATGYHGDMTRTFLKGTPSEAQAKLVATVRAGHQLGLRSIRAGRNGRLIHKAIEDSFAAQGYPTRREEKGWVGFIHGTGHGLGLEIHEPPRISRVDHRLLRGTVVTVEPGLYYPGLGGCRIEDVVQVTADRVRLLSKYHYDWVIA